MEQYVNIEERFLGEAIQISEEMANVYGTQENFLCFLGEAKQIVFRNWLQKEYLDELITYVLYNFARGGGFEWWDDIRRLLQEKKDIKRLHRLFRGLIPGRSDRYRIELKYAQKGFVGNMANAAVAKGELLRVMYEYFNCMYQLGEISVADNLREQIKEVFLDKKKKLSKPIDREITIEVFWELISESTSMDNSGSFISTLESKLVEYKAKEIKKFDQILMESIANLWSWDLWALAFIARRGCSDDAFDYFLAWIISKGKVAYEAAIQGPESLINVIDLTGDLQCEEMLYAASNAYYVRQGKEMPLTKHPKFQRRGNEWEEDELEYRYPMIWERFQKK